MMGQGFINAFYIVDKFVTKYTNSSADTGKESYNKARRSLCSNHMESIDRSMKEVVFDEED